MKFGTVIDLNNISDEFEGQGHRSKVKVIWLKNVIFRVLAWILCMINSIKISCACVRRILRMRMKILRMCMREITKYVREPVHNLMESMFHVISSSLFFWSLIGMSLSHQGSIKKVQRFPEEEISLKGSGGGVNTRTREVQQHFSVFLYLSTENLNFAYIFNVNNREISLHMHSHGRC